MGSQLRWRKSCSEKMALPAGGHRAQSQACRQWLRLEFTERPRAVLSLRKLVCALKNLHVQRCSKNESKKENREGKKEERVGSDSSGPLWAITPSLHPEPCDQSTDMRPYASNHPRTRSSCAHAVPANRGVLSSLLCLERSSSTIQFSGHMTSSVKSSLIPCLFHPP